MPEYNLENIVFSINIEDDLGCLLILKMNQSLRNISQFYFDDVNSSTLIIPTNDKESHSLIVKEFDDFLKIEINQAPCGTYFNPKYYSQILKALSNFNSLVYNPSKYSEY